MIEITINGNKTTRTKKEIYQTFVNTKLYDFITGGFTANPRDEIKAWLKENYILDEINFDYIFTYITVRV